MKMVYNGKKNNFIQTICFCRMWDLSLIIKCYVKQNVGMRIKLKLNNIYNIHNIIIYIIYTYNI